MKIKAIGIDFSINKPAICILDEFHYSFMSWPYGVSDNHLEKLKEAGATIFNRKDKKLNKGNSSEKTRWEVSNARYLSQSIFDVLKNYIDPDTIIAFEGASFASKGNIALQLGGYRYLLMDKLFNIANEKYIYTYAPISIKKTAGCSEKGKDKKDMIEAFLNEEENINFKNYINYNREKFLKKGGKNWIDHLDDFVDAYYLIKTYYEKDFSPKDL